MSPKPLSSTAYQIKVTLRHSKPPIWRRLLVPGDVTLYELNKVIQVAMGWTNSHLHQFIVGETFYTIPRDDDWEPVEDERNYRLAQIAPTEKSKFLYEYDFGDGWVHVVLVEKILPLDPKVKYPCCLRGKRACPPEDVGGIWGYEEFLEAMRDPTHEEHESYVEWWGDTFDPEAFDLDETNDKLQALNKMPWWDGF